MEKRRLSKWPCYLSKSFVSVMKQKKLKFSGTRFWEQQALKNRSYDCEVTANIMLRHKHDSACSKPFLEKHVYSSTAKQCHSVRSDDSVFWKLLIRWAQIDRIWKTNRRTPRLHTAQIKLMQKYDFENDRVETRNTFCGWLGEIEEIDGPTAIIKLHSSMTLD